MYRNFKNKRINRCKGESMIKSLQGLRVLAMFGVFLFHAGLLPNGIFPVTFFFILSGFVTYKQYYNKNISCSFKSNIIFALKKISKLYPIHLFTLILSTFIRIKWLFSFTLFENIIRFVLNLLLMQSLFPKYSLSFNAVSWYLSTLFIIYMFIPLLLKLVNYIKINYIISGLFVIFSFEVLLGILISTYDIDYMWFLYISPYFRIIDFLIGMILCKLYFIKFEKIKRINFTFLEILSICILLISYYLSFILPKQFTRGICYVPAFIVLIFVFANQIGTISKFLSLNIFQKIALFSFEFYMIHELLIMLMRKLCSIINLNQYLGIIFAFILSLICSFELNKLITKKIHLDLSQYFGHIKVKFLSSLSGKLLTFFRC